MIAFVLRLPSSVKSTRFYPNWYNFADSLPALGRRHWDGGECQCSRRYAGLRAAAGEYSRQMRIAAEDNRLELRSAAIQIRNLPVFRAD